MKLVIISDQKTIRLVLGKIWQKNSMLATPLDGCRPTSGKPWIRHWILFQSGELKPSNANSKWVLQLPRPSKHLATGTLTPPRRKHVIMHFELRYHFATQCRLNWWRLAIRKKFVTQRNEVFFYCNLIWFKRAFYEEVFYTNNIWTEKYCTSWRCDVSNFS